VLSNLMHSKRFPMVAMLSSAARIPLPSDAILLCVCACPHPSEAQKKAQIAGVKSHDARRAALDRAGPRWTALDRARQGTAECEDERRRPDTRPRAGTARAREPRAALSGRALAGRRERSGLRARALLVGARADRSAADRSAAEEGARRGAPRWR